MVARKRKTPQQPSRANKGKKAPPSSTGKVRDVRADQTNWRRRLANSRIKFDDDQKELYLAEMRLHGLKGRSAEVTGVSRQCVQDHRENDPDFDEAVGEAIETYRDYIAANVRERATVGDLKPIFFKGARVIEPILDENGVQQEDAEGKPRWRYAEVYERSDRMLELEAKRVDPTYREKTTIDLQGTGGGVLLAPAGVTPEEEVANNEKLNAEARRAHQERMTAAERERGGQEGGGAS